MSLLIIAPVIAAILLKNQENCEECIEKPQLLCETSKKVNFKKTNANTRAYGSNYPEEGEDEDDPYRRHLVRSISTRSRRSVINSNNKDGDRSRVLKQRDLTAGGWENDRLLDIGGKISTDFTRKSNLRMVNGISSRMDIRDAQSLASKRYKQNRSKYTRHGRRKVITGPGPNTSVSYKRLIQTKKRPIEDRHIKRNYIGAPEDGLKMSKREKYVMKRKYKSRKLKRTNIDPIATYSEVSTPGILTSKPKNHSTAVRNQIMHSLYEKNKKRVHVSKSFNTVNKPIDRKSLQRKVLLHSGKAERHKFTPHARQKNIIKKQRKGIVNMPAPEVSERKVSNIIKRKDKTQLIRRYIRMKPSKEIHKRVHPSSNWKKRSKKKVTKLRNIQQVDLSIPPRKRIQLQSGKKLTKMRKLTRRQMRAARRQKLRQRFRS